MALTKSAVKKTAGTWVSGLREKGGPRGGTLLKNKTQALGTPLINRARQQTCRKIKAENVGTAANNFLVVSRCESGGKKGNRLGETTVKHRVN